MSCVFNSEVKHCFLWLPLHLPDNAQHKWLISATFHQQSLVQAKTRYLEKPGGQILWACMLLENQIETAWADIPEVQTRKCNLNSTGHMKWPTTTQPREVERKAVMPRLEAGLMCTFSPFLHDSAVPLRLSGLCPWEIWPQPSLRHHFTTHLPMAVHTVQFWSLTQQSLCCLTPAGTELFPITILLLLNK